MQKFAVEATGLLWSGSGKIGYLSKIQVSMSEPATTRW